LQHQLELLEACGIDRSLLLVAYLGERIEEYFADGEVWVDGEWDESVVRAGS